MARAEPRKVARYGDQFKATAVKLSSLPGVLIQDVAAALDIHSFVLSLWRKQVRDGVIVAKSAKLDVQTAAELKRLRDDAAKGKIRQIRHHFWCPFLVRHIRYWRANGKANFFRPRGFTCRLRHRTNV